MGGIVVARYRVLVNPQMTVSEGVARGKYDWVDPDVTQEHFPVERIGGSRSLRIELVGYPSNTSTEVILRDFAASRRRPSGLAAALAVGEHYPRAQKKRPIVFLGSRWVSPGGFVCAPVLDMNGRRRELSLEPYDVSWCSQCLFAGERK